MTKATLSHAVFVLAALAAAFVLHGCDSAGPTAQEEPEETENEPEPTITLLSETQREGIRLDWEGENFGDKDYFRVYRSTEAGVDTSGAAIADTSATALVDAGRKPSNEYYYRVGAFGEEDEPIVLSEEERALSPPGEPAGLEGEGEFYRSALQWEPAEGAEGGYRVYRSREPFSSPSEAEQIGSTQEASFTDSTALDGVDYTYRVAAVGPEGDEGTLSSEIQATPSFEGDPLAGERVFEESCSTCHANTDAADLQTFGFPDTTIHRRALDHITEEESFDVIEFIRSGDAPRRQEVRPEDPNLPPFQPGGRVLDSDKEFAMELFGKDEWPEDLTREELLRMHPSEQPIPFELPRWSDESDKFDWVAQQPLPDLIAEDSGVQQALSQYRSNRTDANLVRLWRAIQDARPEDGSFRHAHLPNGVTSQDQYAKILEFNRWVSVLVGSHALREDNERKALRDLMKMTVDGKPVIGREAPIKEMWTLGDMFRLARTEVSTEGVGTDFVAGLPDSYGTNPSAFQLAEVRWFYLSWTFVQESFDYGLEYISGHLGEEWALGYKRVNAYLTAYSTAALRLDRGGAPFNVLNGFEKGTPQHWQPDLLPFVLDNILYHIDQGRKLKFGHKFKRKEVNETIDYVLDNNSHLTDEDRQLIRDKRDQIIEFINEQEKKYGG